jgi:hypothetical protein
MTMATALAFEEDNEVFYFTVTMDQMCIGYGKQGGPYSVFVLDNYQVTDLLRFIQNFNCRHLFPNKNTDHSDA